MEDRSPIFVSIASYRDPELRATVEECLARARFPERLRFGICWQHGPEEPPLPWFGDARFRILDVDCLDSRGACWARAEIMKLWEDEPWYLQLDSHHRFVAHWDVRLLEQIRLSPSERPVLTAYCAPYTNEDPAPEGWKPMVVELDYFTDDGIPLMRAGHVRDWGRPPRPRPGRFACAHFLCAPGSFVEDVPYDPDLYYEGEEITLAVRAFTHGYDLFHPADLIVRHRYIREDSRKHWDDHLGDVAGVAWHERDAASRRRVRRLLTEPWTGRHGCGEDRTIDDYEAYAGLSFSSRAVEPFRRGNGQRSDPMASTPG